MNPRSTVATTTEIYDYLRLLYAHVGQPHCPDTGVPIVTQSTSDIVDKILALPPKTRVLLLAPVVRRQKGEFRDVIERLAREGFVRARVDGEFVELEADTRVKLDKKKFHSIEAVVDRLVIDEKIRVRLSDSVETALRWGNGVMFALHQMPTESKVQSPKSKVGESADDSKAGNKSLTRPAATLSPPDGARDGARGASSGSEIRNPKSGLRRCTRTGCVRRPRAKALIRPRPSIFPSTRRRARARSATASVRK